MRWNLAPLLLLTAASAVPTTARGDTPAGPRRFVYVGDTDYAPYDALDASGRPTGFNVELLRALARVAGVEVEIHLENWNQARADFDAGKADLISLSYSEERSKTYVWLAQTWTMHQCVLFLPGRPAYPRGPSELAAETIAVQDRSAVQELLFGLAPPQPTLIRVATQREALRLLDSRAATGVGGNSLSLRIGASQAGMPNLVEMPLKAVPYGLVAKRGREADLAWVAASMSRLRDAGAVEALAERFLAVPPPGRTWRDYAILMALLLSVVGVLTAGVLAWNHSLRGRVKERTRELESTLREREELARFLKASEERYRTFMALSSEGIARLELDEPVAVALPEAEQVERILASARLAEFNDAFRLMFGRSPSELAGGARLADFAAMSEMAERVRLFLRCDYRLVNAEALRQRPDGTQVWVSTNALGIVEDGFLKAAWLTQRDITAQKNAEDELRQRGRIQEAVAFASARLLEPGRWEDRAPQALARLGEAVGVSCTYIFENHEEGGVLRSSLKQEWTSGGVPPLAENPSFQGFPWPAAGPLRAALARDEPITALVRELPERARGLLGNAGIQSLLIVPIFVGGRWWGLLGFGEFRFERRWSSTEIEVVRTAAVSIGGALLREQAEAELRETEQRFARLAAASFEAIAITEGGVFVDGNEQLATLLGCPISQLIGRSPLEFVAEQDRELVASHLASGSEEPYAHLARKSDGTVFPVEIHGKPIPYKGRAARVTALRDMTERVRAEEALRESEKRHRDIFDYAPVGIYQSLRDGTIVTANPALAQILGYDRVEDVLGLNLARDVYLDPGERARLIARYAGIGHAMNVELQLKRRDGTAFWADMTAHVVKDDAGGIHYFEGFLQDISARKAAQEALRSSEERYRLLFDGNPLPMLVSDLETLRFLAVNEAAVRQYGYTREELLGMTIADLAVPGEDLERYIATRHDPRPDLLHVGPRQQRRKDGSVIDIDLTSLVITFGGRDARMALARDVTLERKAEAERASLQAAIERAAADWQRTVDAVDTCVLVLDRDGYLKRVNRAARDLLGKDYSDVVDHRLEDVASEEPWRTAAEALATARTTNAPVSRQATDGRGGLTWDLTALLAAGSRTGEERSILVVRDITHLVTLQESLRRSETMSAMGSLVAGVAHEVRNPLFSISATVDALESDLEGDQEHAEYTDLLRSQVARLTQLMHDLLDYGKPPLLRPAPVQLGEILKRAARSCAGQARERGVALTEAIPAQVPRLRLDAGRMEQVFQNLIANAIQHSPAGGSVRVEARLVPGPDGAVELSVEDTGKGLADADIPHLFEPFFSRRKGGTGLGLSIVQRIVEAHGGRVTAGNGASGGAVFTVRLPAAVIAASEVTLG